MKILVYGKSGQLGLELQRRAGDVVLDVRDEFEADFTNPDACAAMAAQTDADAIIIAAAYTAVDKAESDEDLALAVNGTTPGAIARAAAARGLPVVLVSTDYVFDGSGEQPFSIDAPTGPLGAYGRTKLVGETAVRDAGGPHAILRTSWVVSSHGHNFVKTMLRLGAERDRLTIVADQVGGPTPAAALADACMTVADRLVRDASVTGTYHVTGGPDVSWADFAREIFRQSGTQCEVADIPTRDYPTPARRPLNSRLDNSMTQTVFGLPRPDWRAGLTDILKDLGAYRA
ncbi:dTDP-4-dehydrorhamnose reductase [Meridianimarinicoccus roseus]|uniref:dTDP-4-dehydrorhamnose reductase n=1 Tax=Meridianimarinicoccus roseus TaxID=2072018 RepID=A0A2V2LR90_9RHOB|nr:dTDP-4-dehydrorhamnose reductase [Meridianimarinicoccus roseus]PWR01972.1 dTDP-4-dehydrorhamnose reductase [Meridianimarinicoccus roseus]PWR02742.1 dTDP-4-dehydrorhamnose reductase [Meridianimarinicoccus roseus]PWR03993.1 dTDP-4-dehydrorhamnose reductase [Meridianimarinicoccus roseus]PWR04346.1 dTDP-4-dehydrorhamnose reductase [Meridianimarinicoccus roseus]